MSSILTNNAAMTALQTLKGINNNLEKTQSQISTGKKIASAKDNSAIWAISKTMEADIEGFKSISDTLGIGDSKVGTAKNAAESVTDLLTQIKGRVSDAKAVAEGGSEAEKIQTEIESLAGQIKSVVDSAQVNGTNLVNGSLANATADGNVDGEFGVNVLASLDRGVDGNVSQTNIAVDAQDLSQAEGTALASSAATAGSTGAVSAGSTATFGGFTFQGSGSSAVAGASAGADYSDNTKLLAGDVLTMNVGEASVSYRVSSGDDASKVASSLEGKLNSSLSSDFGVSTSSDTISVANNTGDDVEMSFEATRGTGRLAGLGDIDVRSNEGINSALGSVESMIQTSIDAAAEFGSSQNRIQTQQNFVGNLMDSLESGVGSLVDANMEEASARLQALQVQQQLGTQSLSIANQSPQSILSLFG